MKHKGEEYRQHKINLAITRMAGNDCIKAKGSVTWTDVSGVFHLHPLPEISSSLRSPAAAEKELIERARLWIDNRLKL